MGMFFTPEEVATEYKVSLEVVNKWLDDENLTSLRIGSEKRVQESALQGYLAALVYKEPCDNALNDHLQMEAFMNNIPDVADKATLLSLMKEIEIMTTTKMNHEREKSYRAGFRASSGKGVE